ncbi:uncharacterized protein LOC110434217 [Sorghum bicolor]|uniref:Uncharacterized protein n=1 Tax=Sorghum bicolor TaxID=4558 RepID=A0A1B6Q1L7_SORBI|nr:uncharacterized protein LOC110434217 [Sorghum bicolor]XP_021313728.1 uncharacterized protein LOC110434217 [Sorghum bicolor]KXG31824.1 hypothetical protein SORBI_3003G063700 [Sorghum bicolor]OQU86278.1 hypothetical protein SORBI_3003G063700 [Sorghum bicolor]|eukprot:XP_021313727.1 uncharacterized protein LOC110434217 [Sorghum bicolor]
MADKAAPLPLTAVSVEKEEEEEQQIKKKHVLADPPPFLPAGVRHVIIWALFNAGCFAFSIAYVLVVTSISQLPSWLLPPRTGPEPEEMTDGAVDAAVVAWVLWCVCVVSQAAAGALAALLELPRHRRLVLAYAALVATAAGHCLWAGLHFLFVVAGNPGGLSFWTGVNTAAIFISGVVDIICFRGLILGGGEEKE